jgi:hypothetical protein
MSKQAMKSRHDPSPVTHVTRTVDESFIVSHIILFISVRSAAPTSRVKS